MRRARLVLALLLGANSAAADEPRVHDGFFLRVSLGGAAQQTTLAFAGQPTGSAVHRASGFGSAFAFAAGGTVAPGLALAGELSAQAVDSLNTTPGRGSPLSARSTSTSALLGMVDWYPWPRRGLHLLGGAGVASISVELASDPDGADPRTRAGVAWAFGAGVERFVSERWSLGVIARFDACLATDESGDGDRAGPRFNAASRAATLAVAGTYH